jgi:hypothetical protein
MIKSLLHVSHLLEDLISIHYNWNVEVIAQFYATIYI